MVNEYCTLSEFKAYALPQATASTTDDAVIVRIIEGVSRWIDEQTGRRFGKNSTDEVRYFSPSDFRTVYVGEVVSIASVALDLNGSREYATALDAAYYDLAPYNAALEGKPYNGLEIRPLSPYTFSSVRGSVKITGVFGWPSVPAHVKEMCLDIAKNVYHRRNGEGSGAGSATITAAGVVITPRDLSDFSRSTLATLRNIT